MMLSIISSLLTLAFGAAAYTWKRDPNRSFCFINEDCPDLRFCRKHQCKFPKSSPEWRIVASIVKSRRIHTSSEDETCKRHPDCKADGYLCDKQEGKCRKAHKVFAKITSKCEDFKKSCYMDSDCSCSGYRMKCEAEADGLERECVFVKQSSSSLSSSLAVTQTKRRISRKDKILINEIVKA